MLVMLLAAAALAFASSRDLIADGAKATAAARAPIAAHGIDGSLVLCGAGEVSREAIDEFSKLAGGKKGHIVVIRGAESSKEGQVVTQRLLDSWDAKGMASFVVLRMPLTDADAHHLKQATGVWLADGDAAKLKAAVGAACLAVVKRGGVIGAAGLGTEALATLIPPASKDGAKSAGLDMMPDSIIVARPAGEKGKVILSALLKQNPALVGYELAPGSAMVVSGRNMRPLGSGQVTVHLAATTTRPEKAAALTKKSGDLTAFRRAAVERAADFPPALPGVPFVEKGSLVIVGGGAVGDEIVQRFMELAGGKEASIVIMPAAKGDPLTAKDAFPDRFRKYGAKSVTIVVGRKIEEVEKPEYLDAMSKATGIWFHGGAQGKINDAYEGTKLQPMMYEVLKRGGVIGGSSAGASIQTEFLVRGSPGGTRGNLDNMYEGYQRGFNFLPGVAVDQHFSKRKRFDAMTKLMQTYPQYLGIGIDESTAIVVKGHLADVIGKGSIYVYDTTKKVEKGKQDYETIKSGGRLDLKSRQALPVPVKNEPLQLSSQVVPLPIVRYPQMQRRELMLTAA